MDSNRKHLDVKLLWRNLKLGECNTTERLRSLLQETNLSEYDIVFIHTGVNLNNIDTMDGTDVAHDLINIITKIRTMHPTLKIVVSEWGNTTQGEQRRRSQEV